MLRVAVVLLLPIIVDDGAFEGCHASSLDQFKGVFADVRWKLLLLELGLPKLQLRSRQNLSRLRDRCRQWRQRESPDSQWLLLLHLTFRRHSILVEMSDDSAEMVLGELDVVGVERSDDYLLSQVDFAFKSLN